MGGKKYKMADLLWFFTFYVNNLPLCFSCILLKFVMHVTNKQFLEKFNNDWKKNQNSCFIVFFRILLQ